MVPTTCVVWEVLEGGLKKESPLRLLSVPDSPTFSFHVEQMAEGMV